MGSSWAFKITASMIKPTRETLLDYSAYLLLTLSIIAIARVIIGRSELKQLCHVNGTNVQKLIITQNYNESNVAFIPTSKLNVSQHTETIDHNQFCAKYFQAFYPYVLIVESIILLLVGILWVKMSKVQSTVKEFSRLLHQSCKSDWMKNAVASIHSDSKNELEVVLLLNVLFSSATVYNDKAQARCLYERIQKFTYDHEHSRSLLCLYIRKSLIQMFIWLSAIITNMFLFIELEFYIGCMSYADFCSHDTFLRIIWFLGQLLLLIYAIFNCSSLKWINDNTVSKGTCSLIGFACAPGSYRTNFYCRPYDVNKTEKSIRNDMALLLRLGSASNNKMLPYFTAFLLSEWEEKFASFSDETQSASVACALSPVGRSAHTRSQQSNDVNFLPLLSDTS